MNLANYKLLIRAMVPGAKTQVVDNTLLELLINKAVDDVNVRGAIYKANSTFDVTAEQSKYLLTTVLPNYVCMDFAGLWLNDGDATDLDWKRLEAMSRRTLEDQHPQWMNEDSDSPLRYIIEGNNLITYPTPDTSLSSGFWAFYIKKATDMTADTHYPFTGTTTEISALIVFDDAIIDYVRWKLQAMVGNDQKGIITMQEYENTLSRCVLLHHRRLDITGNPNLRMKGPAIN